MKKLFLIIIFTFTFLQLTAQDKKTVIDSIATAKSNVDIIVKIELKSVLSSLPIILKDKIYTFEKSGTISCFDSTGGIVWKHSLPSSIISKPIIADGQLAVGTSNGEIVTLAEFSGEQIQSIGIEDSITTDLSAAEYRGDKDLFLPKQSSSKAVIIFGTKSGNIFCLDLETLQEYWRNIENHGTVNSSIIIYENKILFSGSDGYLYSIDARNGLLNWRWKETALTDFSNSQIICDGRKVFVVSKDFKLYCIDLLLGKLLWKIDSMKILPSFGISGDRKNLLVKSADKRILLISEDKGSIQKLIKRDDEFDDSAIVPFESYGKIYFVNNNSIYVLDKKFKEEMILDLRDSLISSFREIGSNKFLAATANGTILIFRTR